MNMSMNMKLNMNININMNYDHEYEMNIFEGEMIFLPNSKVNEDRHLRSDNYNTLLM